MQFLLPAERWKESFALKRSAQNWQSLLEAAFLVEATKVVTEVKTQQLFISTSIIPTHAASLQHQEKPLDRGTGRRQCCVVSGEGSHAGAGPQHLSHCRRARLLPSLPGTAGAGPSAQIASLSSHGRSPTGGAGEPLGRCSPRTPSWVEQSCLPGEGSRNPKGLQVLRTVIFFHYIISFGGETTCKSPDLSPYP